MTGAMPEPAGPAADRILEAAQARFFAHGFSHASMDQLAADLGMSKKTLYLHFRSKDALLEAVMERFTRRLAESMDAILADRSLDFPARTARLLETLGRRIALLDRHFIEDLNRQAPQVWKKVEDFRRDRIFSVFGSLIREGAAKGHFRKDLDPDLILQIYFLSIQNVLNPRTLSTLPHSAAQVFETLLSVLFEGMLTDKGRRLFAVRH